MTGSYVRDYNLMVYFCGLSLRHNCEPPVHFDLQTLIVRTKCVLSLATYSSLDLSLLIIHQAPHFLNEFVQFILLIINFGLNGCVEGLACINSKYLGRVS